MVIPITVLIHLITIYTTLPKYDDFYHMFGEVRAVTFLLITIMILWLSISLLVNPTPPSVGYCIWLFFTMLPMLVTASVETAFVLHKSELPVWIWQWYSREVLSIFLDERLGKSSVDSQTGDGATGDTANKAVTWATLQQIGWYKSTDDGLGRRAKHKAAESVDDTALRREFRDHSRKASAFQRQSGQVPMGTPKALGLGSSGAMLSVPIGEGGIDDITDDDTAKKSHKKQASHGRTASVMEMLKDKMEAIHYTATSGIGSLKGAAAIGDGDGDRPEPTREELFSRDYDLTQVLATEEGFRLFARHVAREFSAENILFLIEVEQWIAEIYRKKNDLAEARRRQEVDLFDARQERKLAEVAAAKQEKKRKRKALEKESKKRKESGKSAIAGDAGGTSDVDSGDDSSYSGEDIEHAVSAFSIKIDRAATIVDDDGVRIDTGHEDDRDSSRSGSEALDDDSDDHSKQEGSVIHRELETDVDQSSSNCEVDDAELGSPKGVRFSVKESDQQDDASRRSSGRSSLHSGARTSASTRKRTSGSFVKRASISVKDKIALIPMKLRIKQDAPKVDSTGMLVKGALGSESIISPYTGVPMILSFSTSIVPKSKIVHNSDLDEFQQAIAIFEKYVLSSADYCVNLSGRVREVMHREFNWHRGSYVRRDEFGEIVSKVKDGSKLLRKTQSPEDLPLIFRQAQKQIKSLLSDSYLRFKATEHFDHWVVKFGPGLWQPLPDGGSSASSSPVPVSARASGKGFVLETVID
jgi:hypothetical protein